MVKVVTDTIIILCQGLNPRFSSFLESSSYDMLLWVSSQTALLGFSLCRRLPHALHQTIRVQLLRRVWRPQSKSL